MQSVTSTPVAQPVQRVQTAKPKIFFVATEDWYFHLHWLNLASALAATAYDVTVLARVNKHASQIRERGVKLIPLDLPRSARYPWRDMMALFSLIRIYRQEQPVLVHHLALKPVVVGSIAAHIARVPVVVNTLPGLGFVFSSCTVPARFMRLLVNHAMRWLNSRLRIWTVLQNPDDFAVLRSSGLVNVDTASIIRGAGVDMTRFQPGPPAPEPPVVVLAARMLWDKGVGEFLAAARTLRSEGINARFVLVGDADRDNPLSVPPDQLRAWQREGHVEWWGRSDDMPKVFASSHIVCLPSYREGLPTVLLEAGACALPIVTTDAPGCREVVVPGVNGLMVPVRDAQALAEALRQLLLDAPLRSRLGAQGRSIVAERFSGEMVARETLALYSRLLTAEQ